jgi:hypothetical protein
MFSLFTLVHAASNADAVVNAIVPKIVDNIVIPVIQVLFGVTVLVFVWGLYGFYNGDEEKRNQSKNHILWGVVGIFIMISVYGIIRFVANTVGQPQVLPF